MHRIEEQAERDKTRRYWEENAATTCLVLMACIAASALVSPIVWAPFLGSCMAGLLVYIGHMAYERTHGLLAFMLTVGGIALTTGCLYVSMQSGLRSLFWVQEVGALAASVCAAIVVRRHFAQRRAAK